VDRFLTVVAATVGVPAALLGYLLLVEAALRPLGPRAAARLRPWLWLAPTLAILTVFLVVPALLTIVASFQDTTGTRWVGLDNYVYFFTTPGTLVSLRNNLLWLVLFSGGVVVLGLVIALLVDRVRYEVLAKSVIFVPLAISFVAAGVIWKFMYDYRPPSTPQTGTLNALLATAGVAPIPWLVETSINNLALIAVGVWMWTGFGMVILSAALKQISSELLEAARVDGATEWQVFRHITLPLLRPTIAVVATTMVITALKTFDIVYVMTNGAYDTNVLANQMYLELFRFHQFGRGSAVAVVLLLAVIPVMAANIRRFQEQEALR
jgi:alpha-glucoside transport system permease protein